jgi:hypothetical protein
MGALAKAVGSSDSSQAQLYPGYPGIWGTFGGLFHFFMRGIGCDRANMGTAGMACYCVDCDPKSMLRRVP